MNDDTLQSDLAEHEVALQGSLSHEITGTPDRVEARIRWLVANRLEPLGSAAGGWDWLFRDPRDSRLWELTFPLGSLHGPGPRRLEVIDVRRAGEKYDRME
jgi:hypothetical protein